MTTTTKQEQRVSVPTVEARVLRTQRPDGAPLAVEVDGEVWEPASNQGAARRDVRERELYDALRALAGDREAETMRLVGELDQLTAGKHFEARADVLRDIGQTLCQAGFAGVWRMLFFHIVLEDGVLWPDPYEPGAEWQAVWGPGWQRVLDDPAPRMRWAGDEAEAPGGKTD